jgi:hypothetical protein
VAERQIHGWRGTIRDSYGAPVAENVSVISDVVDAAVAAGIANRLRTLLLSSARNRVLRKGLRIGDDVSEVWGDLINRIAEKGAMAGKEF